MLGIMRSKGFRKPPGMTGREFAHSVPGRGGTLAQSITDMYYRIRFGRIDFNGAEKQEVEEKLKELKTWKPAPGRSR
jgi:hypothetical protein